MSTISFFKFQDFVDEVQLQASGPLPTIVRVQSISTRQNSEPSPLLQFEIRVTSQPATDVLVARFRIGSCLSIFLDHEPQHVTNAVEADRILRSRLEAAGFDVRNGSIECQTDSIAHGEGLWSFDRETKTLVEA